MKFNTSQLLLLSLLSLTLTPQISQAQNSPPQPGNTNANTANDWSSHMKTQDEFKLGCVGDSKNLNPQQLKIKTSFCKCALEAYKARYNPQVFFQINNISNQAGKVGSTSIGPVLVNLMMKPELNRCSITTKYNP